MRRRFPRTAETRRDMEREADAQASAAGRIASIVLDEILYDRCLDGGLAVHVYSDVHPGPTWFRRKPVHSWEWALADVKPVVENAIAAGLEVRICNAGDLCVMHFKDGKMLHPDCTLEEFWKRIP